MYEPNLLKNKTNFASKLDNIDNDMSNSLIKCWL